MGLFDKLKDPVFLKDSSDANENLDKLKVIYQSTSDANMKQQIDQDMKVLSYGIAGEEQIAFELKNSHMPMYVLHDLYLEADGLTAQIDYMVITRKCLFVIECKNLIGNIEINGNGDFIRTLQFGSKIKKEGIYSPITQNKRHLEIIKQLRAKTKGVFAKAVFEKLFYSMYHSIVVLANPKTILNAKYAKKEVKDQVIRADQLIEHIKKVNNSHSAMDTMGDKEMEEIATFFLRSHIKNPKDYCDKYKAVSTVEESSVGQTPKSDEVIKEVKVVFKENVKENVKKNVNVNIPMSNNNELLINDLKSFRLTRSREEKIKPYYIFNDMQMMEIISKNPKTKEELESVSGFGNAKCKKYGDIIIGILKKYK